MTKPPASARDAVRATVPKMIEVTENVIYGDIWERPGLSKTRPQPGRPGHVDRHLPP
jgi:hypothetical protein